MEVSQIGGSPSLGHGHESDSQTIPFGKKKRMITQPVPSENLTQLWKKKMVF